MSTFTIHADDCLAFAVRDYADKMGLGVNAAIHDLLASALDFVRPKKPRSPSFLKCAGILDKRAAAQLRAAQADFSAVDTEMWK